MNSQSSNGTGQTCKYFDLLDLLIKNTHTHTGHRASWSVREQKPVLLGWGKLLFFKSPPNRPLNRRPLKLNHDAASVPPLMMMMCECALAASSGPGWAGNGNFQKGLEGSGTWKLAGWFSPPGCKSRPTCRVSRFFFKSVSFQNFLFLFIRSDTFMQFLQINITKCW